MRKKAPSVLHSASIRCPFPTRQYLRSAPRPITALLQMTLPWMLHLDIDKHTQTQFNAKGKKKEKVLTLFWTLLWLKKKRKNVKMKIIINYCCV